MSKQPQNLIAILQMHQIQTKIKQIRSFLSKTHHYHKEMQLVHTMKRRNWLKEIKRVL